MHKYSIIIPHVARNDGLLARSLPYIRQNLSFDRIFVIASKNTLANLKLDDTRQISFVDEDSILPGLTFSGIKDRIESMGIAATRSGWYFQQFIKMAWALRADCSEAYLVWDSDTFPLRPVTFITDEGKISLFTTRQYHPVYFETLRALLGIDRSIDASFIAESMLFERELMRRLIAEIAGKFGYAPEQFYSCILNIVKASSNPHTAFSEFETYGNYAITRAADRYSLRASRSFRNAAKMFGLRPNRFDLFRLSLKYEIVSFERWNTRIWPLIALQKLISFFIFLVSKVTARKTISQRQV